MKKNESITGLTSIEEQFASEDTEETRDALLMQLSQSESALIEYLYTINDSLERDKTNDMLIAVAAAQHTVRTVAAKLIKLKRLRKLQR